MDFIGMDTAAGLAHAERLRAAVQRLTPAHEALHSRVQASQGFWTGPDADAFRAAWAEGAALLMQQILTDLDRTASVLEGQVDEQETASASEPATRVLDGTPIPGNPGLPGARYGGGGDGEVSVEVAAAWDQMAPADQKRVLQEIVNQELERQGHPGLTVHFDDADEKGYLGYWREFDILRPWRGEHIVLDEAHAQTPAAINTAAHEARHAAQTQWIEETNAPPAWQFWREDGSAAEYERVEQDYGVTRDDIEAWRENAKDYESGPSEEQPAEDAPQEEKDAWMEEYMEYREQPLETDAFDTGDDFADEMTLEELQQYQRDAGVPVTS